MFLHTVSLTIMLCVDVFFLGLILSGCNEFAFRSITHRECRNRLRLRIPRGEADDVLDKLSIRAKVLLLPDATSSSSNFVVPIYQLLSTVD